MLFKVQFVVYPDNRIFFRDDFFFQINTIYRYQGQ